MEPMTSSRSSKLTALALLFTVLLSVVAPAAAVTVDQTDVPEEGEAGTQLSASFTLTELYKDPKWESWTLTGETDLTNVTWTLTFINPQGDTIDRKSYDGQTFTQEGISTESNIGTVTEVRVEITGEVIAPSRYTYPEKEKFLLAQLTQTRGEEGSQGEIGTWPAHHYTTADQDAPDAAPGTREARTELDRARAAIQEADDVGADTSEANQTLTTAISAYENGNFANAISLAETAREEANEAKDAAEKSDERSQLLMFGGAALAVVVLAGGGFWWYRNQQDDYDKLG